MASATAITEKRNAKKHKKSGKKRKAALRKKGTTPSQAKLFGDKQ